MTKMSEPTEPEATEEKAVSPARREQVDAFTAAMDAYSAAMERNHVEKSEDSQAAVDKAREIAWEELRTPIAR